MKLTFVIAFIVHQKNQGEYPCGKILNLYLQMPFFPNKVTRVSSRG